MLDTSALLIVGLIIIVVPFIVGGVVYLVAKRRSQRETQINTNPNAQNSQFMSTDDFDDFGN